MADDEGTRVSVRGRADRTVEPDHANIDAAITAIEQTASAASSTVGRALDQLRAELEAMGGEPLTAEYSDRPLTWSARSVRTHPEFDHDKSSHYGPTGRHVASIELRIAVRDFTTLPALTGALARDHISMHGVTWNVDADNPAWPLVRADAIRAALIQGQDYAAALGGSVLSVEHVADAGLLGTGGTRHFDGEVQRASGRAGYDEEGVVLDPEPQTLHAVVEARFTATVGALPTR